MELVPRPTVSPTVPHGCTQRLVQGTHVAPGPSPQHTPSCNRQLHHLCPPRTPGVLQMPKHGLDPRQRASHRPGTPTWEQVRDPQVKTAPPTGSTWVPPHGTRCTAAGWGAAFQGSRREEAVGQEGRRHTQQPRPPVICTVFLPRPRSSFLENLQTRKQNTSTTPGLLWMVLLNPPPAGSRAPRRHRSPQDRRSLSQGPTMHIGLQAPS